MKNLQTFEEFLNENHKSSEYDKFFEDILDNNYSEIEITLRYAASVNDIFRDRFKRIGKQLTSNSYSFKTSEELIDFIEIILNTLDMESDELTLS